MTQTRLALSVVLFSALYGASPATANGTLQVTLPAEYRFNGAGVAYHLLVAPVHPTTKKQLKGHEFTATLSLTLDFDRSSHHYSGTLLGKSAELRGQLAPSFAPGVGATGSLLQRTSQASGPIRLRVLEEDGQVKVVLNGKQLSAIRSPLPIDGERWNALAAEQKQRTLGKIVQQHPYAPEALPVLGSKEALNKNWRNNLRILGSLHHLVGAFRSTKDVRTPRWKLRHPFGATATAVFVPEPGHPYTGLFARTSYALVRLSLNVDSASKHNPGIALKLFVDGQPSQNLLGSTFYDPAQLPNSSDFFSHALRNQNDQGVLPTDHAAALNPDGTAVEAPRAPRLLTFKPMATGQQGEDFRTQLGRVAPGSTIYQVLDGDGATIGQIRTASWFVAGDAQDRILHFAHHSKPKK